MTAEATLEGHGIQDLADLMPEILEAAAGDPIVFKVRIEFGGTWSLTGRRWRRSTRCFRRCWRRCGCVGVGCGEECLEGWLC